MHGLHAKKFEMFSCLLIKGHGFLEARRLTIPFAEKQTIKMYTFDIQAVAVGGHLALAGQCVGHSCRQEHWSKSAQIRVTTGSACTAGRAWRKPLTPGCTSTLPRAGLTARWVEVLVYCHGDGTRSMA